MGSGCCSGEFKLCSRFIFEGKSARGSARRRGHVGATVTPAAVRLGERLNHELSLSATLVLWPSPWQVEAVFGFLRYAVLF
jgi:hypothetical protein